MRLYEFFRERVDRGQPLVLVTVFDTIGSTYSKAGGQMIIDGDGNFCGMLSGGCLEGDLVERARNVILTGIAETASYDLGADDELWGLGVGCDGTMRMVLQPLTREFDYQPFAAIANILNGDDPATFAIVTSSDSTTIKIGASVVLHSDTRLCFGMSDDDAQSITGEHVENAQTMMRPVSTPHGNCVVFHAVALPPPSLLILGAGLDSEPIARFAAELGWRCTVSDHRPAYVERRSYPDATILLSVAVEDLDKHVDLDSFDLAIVMSHHLVSDRNYLRQLAVSNIAYIGLLGPVGRHDRLVDELGEVANDLRGRLHGPAGIRLGGRGPGPIALEIIAGMQQFLSDRG